MTIRRVGRTLIRIQLPFTTYHFPAKLSQLPAKKFLQLGMLNTKQVPSVSKRAARTGATSNSMMTEHEVVEGEGEVKATPVTTMLLSRTIGFDTEGKVTSLLATMSLVLWAKECEGSLGSRGEGCLLGMVAVSAVLVVHLANTIQVRECRLFKADVTSALSNTCRVTLLMALHQRFRQGDKVDLLEVRKDKNTGKLYSRITDIQGTFPDAQRFKVNGVTLNFLENENEQL
ncbi:MAG: hypothetical protein JOS17DRAFT_805608 [Linnemannia elongata]|nr:MAG: hypothetical protein JOS17DRAFT_805608 [Linnemannia elongata]